MFRVSSHVPRGQEGQEGRKIQRKYVTHPVPENAKPFQRILAGYSSQAPCCSPHSVRRDVVRDGEKKIEQCHCGRHREGEQHG